MTRLHLGKMTGQELAEWFGVSYNGTYRKKPKEYINKLFGYCEYEQIRGGAIIKVIYKDIYCGDLAKQATQDYIEEIKNKKNKLSSVAGMARKFREEKNEYAQLAQSSVEYQLGKAGQECFGKTNYTLTPEHSGVYGYRLGVWAIKIDDYNNYRYFTYEEEKLFDDIISAYYGTDPKKIKQLAMLDKAFQKDEISKEEYFQQKDELKLDFFGQCIQKFREQTGLIIARVQQHEITYRMEEECAF